MERLKSQIRDINDTLTRPQLSRFHRSVLRTWCQGQGLKVDEQDTLDTLVDKIVNYFVDVARWEKASGLSHQKPIVLPNKFKGALEGKRSVTFADALQRSPSSRKPSLAKKVYFSPDQPPALNLLEIHLSNESPNSTPSPKRPFGTRRNLAKDESPIKFSGFDDIVGDIHRLTEAAVIDTETMTASELTTELRARGLPVSGTKAQKKERLEQHILQDGGTSAPNVPKQVNNKRQPKQAIPAPAPWLKW